MFSKIFKNNPIFKIHLLKKKIFKNIFLNISQKFFFLSFLKKIFFLNFSLKHIFNFLFIIFSFLNFSSAENGKEFTSKVGEEITKFGNNIVSTLTLSFMIVAFCVFAFGIGKFIYARYYSNNSKETFKDLKAGQDFMLWGVIALFILLSIWGIIKILQGFVGIDSSNNKSIKPIRFSSSISKKINKKPARTDNKLLDPDTKLYIKPDPVTEPAQPKPEDNKQNESKTIFSKSGQKFPNGEDNLFIEYDKKKVGEFALIKKGIKILNSKNTNLKQDLETILSEYLNASGIIPGALTTSTSKGYVSEGINVSDGEIFGDDVFHEYGIIYTEKGKINFTHNSEFPNGEKEFKENLLQKVKDGKENLLFLPSVYRNGNFLTSDKKIQHCLIRIKSDDDVKIGVVIFDEEIDYFKAKEILTGLDNDKIKLTHIYYLDAGAWSENVRKIDGNFIKKGRREKDKVTNYIIFE